MVEETKHVLHKLPDSLERRHIEGILKDSVEIYYPEENKMLWKESNEQDKGMGTTGSIWRGSRWHTLEKIHGANLLSGGNISGGSRGDRTRWRGKHLKKE